MPREDERRDVLGGVLLVAQVHGEGQIVQLLRFLLAIFCLTPAIEGRLHLPADQGLPHGLPPSSPTVFSQGSDHLKPIWPTSTSSSSLGAGTAASANPKSAAKGDGIGPPTRRGHRLSSAARCQGSGIRATICYGVFLFFKVSVYCCDYHIS